MGWISLWSFFSDPVIQASTIGSILMCIASSLVGVLMFVRKRSLVGEALSHSTYPGIAIGVLFFVTFFSNHQLLFIPIVLLGAMITSYLGLRFMYFLEERLSMKSDSALCLILSVFLGLGILLASRLQYSQPIWFQKVQMFLYGQAATMVLSHVWMYAILSVCIVIFITLLFPWLKASYFDAKFSKIAGIPVGLLNRISWILLILAVVVGIRSVGVILMAGMLIAPAVAARQYTDRLGKMLVLASIIGAISGFMGNYLSVNLSYLLYLKFGAKIILPTGPMILIVAGSIAILSAMFAPKKGVILRLFRRELFKYRRVKENVIKMIYMEETPVGLARIACRLHMTKAFVYFTLTELMFDKEIYREGEDYFLTKSGMQKAKKIVRYHRLWELYLHKILGFQADNVHKSAEEMEHIITSDIEAELTKLLEDPKLDPHNQQIPRMEVE